VDGPLLSGTQAVLKADYPKTIRVDNVLYSECLNTHWIMTLVNSREKLEDQRDYNEVRTHNTIDYNVPIDINNRGS